MLGGMMIRGILVGIGASLISVVLFSRPYVGAPTLDMKTLQRLVVSFFGGMGIGVGIAACVLIALVYGVVWYGQRAALP